MTDDTPRDPGYPYGEFDASKWAAEFKRLFPDSDDGLMLGWFANAIMTGYDKANLDATRPSGHPAKVEIDRMARALKAEWERIEKAPVTSYVATFADLARVALAARPSGDEALREALDDSAQRFHNLAHRGAPRFRDCLVNECVAASRALATPSSAPDRHAGEATAPIYHLPSAPDVEEHCCNDPSHMSAEYLARIEDSRP